MRRSLVAFQSVLSFRDSASSMMAIFLARFSFMESLNSEKEARLRSKNLSHAARKRS